MALASVAELLDAADVDDAEGLVVGRLASIIATRLRGKHKPTFTPHVDTGDYIVVINAEKVKVTGAKATDKIYHHHTGYPGGRRVLTGADLIERKPEFILHEAVRRMLPKNKLRDQMLKRLHVFTGSEHPHEAQQPTPVSA